MFGIRAIKAQPTQYVIQFRNGRPRREGAGLTMLYYAPTSALVVVPTASADVPFMFEEVTADFQNVTIQGQVSYRIADPRRTAALLDFGVDGKGRYVSEEPAAARRDRSAGRGPRQASVPDLAGRTGWR
jgi:superoxide dismutase